MKSSLDISLPPRVESGVPISSEWAKSVIGCLQRLRDRSESSLGIVGPSIVFPPLWAHFEANSDEDFMLYLTDGKVVARDYNVGDCVTTWNIEEIPTFEEPLIVTGALKIWIKVSESGNGVVTAAEFGSGAEWLESLAPELSSTYGEGTAGYRYYRVAEITEDPDCDGEFICTQLLTGHIDHFQPNLTAAGGGEDHPWKVTANATANQWDVVLGTIYGHGVEITPTIASPFTFTPASTGFIYLKITRDATTRVPSAAVVLAAATVPTSGDESAGDQYHYRALAYVTSAPSVLQLQFEEMRILEIAIVENGAFKLAPLELSSRNTYALPT